MPDSMRTVDSLAELAAALGPAAAGGRAVILLGGADFTEPDRIVELRQFFGTLAGNCQRTGSAVVDGGTDSGVMRLFAEARVAAGGTFRLIGVAPRGAFERTTRTGGPILPARDHDLILRVPGDRFGDETEWLFAAADHLAGGASATVVVNGGHLARDEAHLRLAAGHRVIAVEGSGRTADDLAADQGLRGSGRLVVVPLTVDARTLAAALEGDPEP
jgi:hypothetical protein